MLNTDMKVLLRRMSNKHCLYNVAMALFVPALLMFVGLLFPHHAVPWIPSALFGGFVATSILVSACRTDLK
ncbi:hypothetical protein ACI2KR_29055 [Pseudomonas luteola]